MESSHEEAAVNSTSSEEQTYQDVTRAIRAIMASHKDGPISIAELARRVGTTRPNMSNYLAGKTGSGMPLLTFLKVADALGVTPDEIVRRSRGL